MIRCHQVCISRENEWQRRGTQKGEDDRKWEDRWNNGEMNRCRGKGMKNTGVDEYRVGVNKKVTFFLKRLFEDSGFDHKKIEKKAKSLSQCVTFNILFTKDLL